MQTTFYNIAKADNVFYFLNTLFGELGDVYQTFFPGANSRKAPKSLMLTTFPVRICPR